MASALGLPGSSIEKPFSTNKGDILHGSPLFFPITDGRRKRIGCSGCLTAKDAKPFAKNAENENKYNSLPLLIEEGTKGWWCLCEPLRGLCG